MLHERGLETWAIHAFHLHTHIVSPQKNLTTYLSSQDKSSANKFVK
jgi:hypothetical protein